MPSKIQGIGRNLRMALSEAHDGASGLDLPEPDSPTMPSRSLHQRERNATHGIHFPRACGKETADC